MGLASSIFQKFRERAEKNKAESERLQSMQRDMEFQKRMQLEEEQRERIRLESLEKAKQEFVTGSGVNKLKAYNAIKKLENPETGGSDWMRKLGEYTRANKMKREERIAYNKDKLALAKQMSHERIMKRQQERAMRMARNQMIRNARRRL